MRFSINTIVAFLLIGSALGAPVNKSSGSKTSKTLSKGDTGAEIGTLSTGEKGVISKEGDNIPLTAQHIADAKKKNPVLDQPVELQSSNNRPDVLKEHDGGSPTGSGPQTKDEFPLNKEKVPGLSHEDQVKQTDVQKLPSKEQGGVKADQADPAKGKKNQGALASEVRAKAKELSAATKGDGVKVEHVDNRTGS